MNKLSVSFLAALSLTFFAGCPGPHLPDSLDAGWGEEDAGTAVDGGIDGGFDSGFGNDAGTDQDGGTLCRMDATVHATQAVFFNWDESASTACGLPRLAGAGIAAVAPSLFAGSAACGSCFEVSGPKGSKVVQVGDISTSLEGTQFGLELDQETFALLADPLAGSAQISYRAVPCPVDGGLNYFLRDGSNPYFLSFRIENHRNPISQLEIEVDSTWVVMPRTNNNAFETTASAAPFSAPYLLRVTDVFGNQVKETVSVTAGARASGSQQLPVCE